MWITITITQVGVGSRKMVPRWVAFTVTISLNYLSYVGEGLLIVWRGLVIGNRNLHIRGCDSNRGNRGNQSVCLMLVHLVVDTR
jgi:hypothetical protein